MAELRLRNPEEAKQARGRRFKLKELGLPSLKLPHLLGSKSKTKLSANVSEGGVTFESPPVVWMPTPISDAEECTSDRPPSYRRSSTDLGSTADAATQTVPFTEDEPSQLVHCSKARLVEMLTATKAKLEEKDSEVCDLHDYVEQLLVRIMKIDADLLQHGTAVERLESHAA